MFSSIDDLYEHPSGGGPLNYNVTKNWYASKKHFNRAPGFFIDLFVPSTISFLITRKLYCRTLKMHPGKDTAAPWLRAADKLCANTFRPMLS